MTREGTRKVTEKEVPQVPVRQEGLITLGFKFRKGVMPKAPSSSPLPLHPHLPMRLLARKRLLTPQIQKWLQNGRDTQAKLGEHESGTEIVATK